MLSTHHGLLLERLLCEAIERQFCHLHPEFGQALVPFGSQYPESTRYFRPFSTAYLSTTKAETLALLRGGFDPIEAREDLILTEKLSVLRGMPTAEHAFINYDTVRFSPLRLCTGVRRHVVNYVLGVNAGDATRNPYLNFGDQAEMNALRAVSSAEVLKRDEHNRNLINDLPNLAKQFTFWGDHYVHVFRLVAPEQAEQALAACADFLSSYFGGDRGTVQYASSKFHLQSPAVLARFLRQLVVEMKDYSSGVISQQVVSYDFLEKSDECH